LAKSATVNQLRHALSKYVHVVDPTPDVTPTEAALAGGDPRNSLIRFFDEHGRYILQLNAPTDQGEIINQAIREARDALFLAGNTKVTWLQAFVEVCNRSLGTITSPARRDRFRTYIHLNTDDEGGPAHAWINAGPSLPDAIRDVLLCDGIVRPLWHTAGLPVNVGRAHRIVPPHTRRQVLDRDRTCVHPACEATTHLEVHHIHDWLKHGRTETSNLAALCPKEHDALHRGEFTMAGNPNIPGDLKFYDNRGRHIPNTGKPNPPNRPPPAPPPGKKYTHPTGERLDTRWLTFTEAPTPATAAS
jgi:HNH endonuclease